MVNTLSRLVAASSISLLGVAGFPSSTYNPISERVKKQRHRFYVLEKLLKRKYTLAEERARRNNYHAIYALSRQDDAPQKEQDLARIRKDLVARLQAIKHTHRPQRKLSIQKQYKEGIGEIYQLSPQQLMRVYLLVGALKSQKFVHHIGSLLEKDVKDIKAEHGGVILYTGLGLKFKGYPSILERILINNNYYKAPKRMDQEGGIAVYHFHAISEDNSQYAGPSNGMMLGLPLLNGDLAVAQKRASHEGESHNVVVTKLKGKNFNIDYYGGARNKHGFVRLVVLDLGNYSYAK